jgi:hypothetical protein
MTIDVTFNDKGQVNSLFYEPTISKPKRGHRDVTIKLKPDGKLEGIPTVWREALDMTP